MLRYMILSLISLLYLNSCLPTSNCPQCSVQVPIIEPEKPLVRIGASSLNMPPYFITTENTGLEKDIIEAAFLKKGYRVSFEFVNDRKKMFHEGKFDCITTVVENPKYPAFYTYGIVPYQDQVIYLENPTFTINSLDDLKDRKIEAFKDAKKILELQDLKLDKNYREHSSKASQVLMLYHRSIDVLIMDIRMFGFYRKKMLHKIVELERKKREEIETKKSPETFTHYQIKTAALFPAQAYQMACKNEKHRNDFNEGLNLIKQSNPTNENSMSDYDKIFKKPEYLSHL